MPTSVIGFRKTSFTAKDTNETISGYNIYIIEDIDPRSGEGQSAERLFMTSEKLIACGYKPSLGDIVKVEYNRYGKLTGIFVVQ